MLFFEIKFNYIKALIFDKKQFFHQEKKEKRRLLCTLRSVYQSPHEHCVEKIP